MSRSLTVLSITSAEHVVNAFHESIVALAADGIAVTHVGLSTNLWYPGDAYEIYRGHGCPTHHIPRPSGCTIPWWHTPDATQEVFNALDTIEKFLDEMIKQYRADVLLFADDQGPLELAFIKFFNRRHVPVVLLEHGYDSFEPAEPPSVTPLSRRLISTIRAATHTVSRKLFRRCSRCPRRSELLCQRPVGLNGDYLICTYAGLNTHILMQQGVAPSRLRPTGYPYLDQYARRRQTLIARPKPNRPKLLIVSSGCGIFGQLDRARCFYKLAIEVIEDLKDFYEIVFRFKPGETLDLFLEPHMIKRLMATEVALDWSTANLSETLPKYDLVLGSGSSILLEALILKVPVVIFADELDYLLKHSHPMGKILGSMLNCLSLKTSADARTMVCEALSPHYLAHLDQAMFAYEEPLFHRLDGQSGKRVAQIILEAST